jgi:hypothetical protein
LADRGCEAPEQTAPSRVLHEPWPKAISQEVKPLVGIAFLATSASIVGKIGRMTGKAGVAIATSGPGVSSLVTAWRRQTPALVPTARPGSAMLAVELAKRRQWAS